MKSLKKIHAWAQMQEPLSEHKQNYNRVLIIYHYLKVEFLCTSNDLLLNYDILEPKDRTCHHWKP